MLEKSDLRHPRRFLGSPLFYLILVNLVIFGFQSAGFLREYRPYDGQVELMQFGSLAREDLVVRFEWWRVLTYMFVHDVPDPLHVSLNMLMVFICGRFVQVLLGGRAVVSIYLLGGLVGGLAHVWMFPEPVAGASAAAYALMVVMGMLIPQQRVFVLLGMIFPVRLRMKYLVAGTIVVTAAFFLIDLLAGQGAEIPMVSGIGHLAHLGGALAGFAYCKTIGVGRQLTLADLQAQRTAREAGLPIPSAPPSHPSTGSPGPGGAELDDFSMTEVDPILDKIVREGFLSLSKEEREILQRGVRLMSRT